MSYKWNYSGMSIGNRVARKPSCDEILPRLYLGDILVATNKEQIASMGITDMISIEIKPLKTEELAPTINRYLYINVMDHSKQDIMSHFQASNEFIETALKSPSNRVYVHCVAGISRSASLVIAYIMKTRSMSYMDAFDIVFAKRRIIDPNEGFVKQLYLYAKMNYTIDICDPEYRLMVLDALIFEFRLLTQYHVDSTRTRGPAGFLVPPIRSCGSAANKDNIPILFDQYYNKLHLQQVDQHPQVYSQSSVYKCTKCRAKIFYPVSIIDNMIVDRSRSIQNPNGPTLSCDSKDSRKALKVCELVFIEPQPWMSRNILDSSGVLHCYKCRRKLGKFDWTGVDSCRCPKHIEHSQFNLIKILTRKVRQGDF